MGPRKANVGLNTTQKLVFEIGLIIKQIELLTQPQKNLVSDNVYYLKQQRYHFFIFKWREQ